MGLVLGMTKAIQLESDPGHSATIRKLSWKELEEAAETRTSKVLAMAKAMGSELMREMGPDAREREDVQAAMADRANNYDREAVLAGGIREWSFDQPVTAENIRMLEPATAEELFQAIIEFTLPPSQEARGKDSSSSI